MWHGQAQEPGQDSPQDLFKRTLLKRTLLSRFGAPSCDRGVIVMPSLLCAGRSDGGAAIQWQPEQAERVLQLGCAEHILVTTKRASADIRRSGNPPGVFPRRFCSQSPHNGRPAKQSGRCGSRPGSGRRALCESWRLRPPVWGGEQGDVDSSAGGAAMACAHAELFANSASGSAIPRPACGHRPEAQTRSPDRGRAHAICWPRCSQNQLDRTRSSSPTVQVHSLSFVS